MRKRIFVGINISEKEKKMLAKTMGKWENLPARWTKQDSLHAAVLFIGSAMDSEIADICDNVRQAAKSSEPFDLNFNRIGFGPEQDKKKRIVPRMIWAFGEKSGELAALKNAIERQLRGLNGNSNSIKEDRQQDSPAAFSAITPHITLGRIFGSKWKKLENPPEIDEKIRFAVSVDSIEIMESNMLKDGAEYIILESIKL